MLISNVFIGVSLMGVMLMEKISEKFHQNTSCYELANQLNVLFDLFAVKKPKQQSQFKKSGRKQSLTMMLMKKEKKCCHNKFKSQLIFKGEKHK
ncbi:CLUMA_CG021603, isoform A [Clunio marinus]|uniref:CLUMA_CG021603, isoform A n=1 Tax=Clunio marinus TaxID=568069 RepID=A0A1J1J8D0_9DIPT|nr:CLUMA_CG021603, isoform A [Clunio marinus]